MDSPQLSKTPPLLIALPRQSMELLPAPLEGASVTLRQNGGSSSQRYQHERSSLPIPAPSPPPQTISSGDNSSTSKLGAGSGHDAAQTGYNKRSDESAPLVAMGPESPTFISSPTGLLPISTGLSPTKGPYRGFLASVASGSPSTACYYAPTGCNQQQTLTPMHAAPSSVGAFTPHSSTSGVYPQPLYMTTRHPVADAAAATAAAGSVTAAAGCGIQPASRTAGLPQEQIKTEDCPLQGGGGPRGSGGPATKETSCGGASLASLDSSSFFAITPAQLSSTSDLADLTHPELERMLLRGSPVTTAATGGGQMPMVAAAAQRHRHQTTADPDSLRDFDAFDVRLVDGGGLEEFPAVVGGLCGGCAGGRCDSSDDSSGDNAAGGGGGVGGTRLDKREDDERGRSQLNLVRFPLVWKNSWRVLPFFPVTTTCDS